MSRRDDYREGFHLAGLTIVFAGFGGLLLVAVGVMWFLGAGLFSQHTANFRGETAKRNLIEANGAYRTAAYDHFFDLCASIEGLEGQIRVQSHELHAHPEPDIARASQIQVNLTALRSQLVTAIAQYNADAAKGYTAGQFRADNLPAHLYLTQETRCVA